MCGMIFQSNRGLFLSFLEFLEDYKKERKKIPLERAPQIDLEFMISLSLLPDCSGIRSPLHSLPKVLTFSFSSIHRFI